MTSSTTPTLSIEARARISKAVALTAICQAAGVTTDTLGEHTDSVLKVLAAQRGRFVEHASDATWDTVRLLLADMALPFGDSDRVCRYAEGEGRA